MWIVVGLITSVVFGLIFLVAGTAGGYPLMKACGVTEFEGKAGYYAFFFVGAPLAVAGACLGFTLIYRIRHVF